MMKVAAMLSIYVLERWIGFGWILRMLLLFIEIMARMVPSFSGACI